MPDPGAAYGLVAVPGRWSAVKPSRAALVPPLMRREGVKGGAPAQIGPAPARVAAAPRQGQTRWVVCAVALVLFGGLLLLYALPVYTGHRSVVVLARDVTAGATLTAADVTTAEVSVGEQVAVVRPQDGVLGKTALTDLPAGSLLSPRSVGESATLTAGQVMVPVRAKLGQRPQQGLRFGQQVLAVPAPEDPTSPSGQALAQGQPIRATVVSVGEPDPATGHVVVDLRVPDSDGLGLARAAATGSVTLVVLSQGGGS
jgi:hypothetical protein